MAQQGPCAEISIAALVGTQVNKGLFLRATLDHWGALGNAPSLVSLKIRAHRFLYAAFNSVTIYGRLGKTLVVGTMRITYNCPFAFLRCAAERSAHFEHFLTQRLALGPNGARVGRICIYCDEVAPGNALRPDFGRKYHAIYWTILELPEWFRRRELKGFWPLARPEKQ